MSVHTIDWYRPPVSQQQINERSDFLGLAQAGGYLATMCFTGMLAYIAYLKLRWPWVVAAIFLYGTVCSFLINAVHELTSRHGFQDQMAQCAV